MRFDITKATPVSPMYNVKRQEPTDNPEKLLGDFEWITSRNRSLNHQKKKSPDRRIHCTPIVDMLYTKVFVWSDKVSG